MTKGRFMILGVLVISILLAASPASAAKKDTLVVGFGDVFSTLDHYQSTHQGVLFSGRHRRGGQQD